MIKRLLTEPLLHFLVLGAGLFALHAALKVDAGPQPDEIVVTEGQVQHLAETFAKTWQRPPTRDELKGLVDGHIEDEVLAREAVKLGLHEDDTVIRRRLRQKMTFVFEDLAAEPTEAELRAYLEQHRDRYAEDPRFTFRHVYLNPEQRGESLEADAAALLDDLRAAGGEADTRELGDRLLLPDAYILERKRSLAAQFGEGFAEALDAVEPGAWAGPIRSGFGLHLVYVDERRPGGMPAYEKVERAVRRDLMHERREAANRAVLDRLLERYRVVVEWPGDEPAVVQTGAASP